MHEIEIIKKELLNDQIILFPTDTVYGLLANGYSKQAMENLFLIKNRPQEKTFAIFTDKKKLNQYVELNNRNRILFEKFTPGAVTFILKNKNENLKHLEIEGKIGIRIPKNKFLQKLLENLNFPIIATSANISGKNTPTNYENIDETIKNHELTHNINYEYLLDKQPSGFSSSIFDISRDEIKILREGEVQLSDLYIAIQ